MADLKVILGDQVTINYPGTVRGRWHPPSGGSEELVAVTRGMSARTELSIVGHPDEDLEPGQVLLNFGADHPSVTVFAADLNRALLPFLNR